MLTIRIICHARDLWKLAPGCKQLPLLRPPSSWNLPGAGWLSGFQGSWEALKVVSKCSFISNKGLVNIWNDRKAKNLLLRRTCIQLPYVWHCCLRCFVFCCDLVSDEAQVYFTCIGSHTIAILPEKQAWRMLIAPMLVEPAYHVVTSAKSSNVNPHVSHYKHKSLNHN